MSERARAAIGSEAIEAVADRGYYNGEEILACEQSGITVYLPKPMTSGINAKGRFGKQDFVYVAADDVYLCPAGEQLTYRYTNEEDGKTLRRYWTTACQACGLKGDEREFEAVFAKLIQLRTGGLVIGRDPYFTARSDQLAALAVRHAVPAAYAWREFAAAGGLLSYGAAITDSYHLAGNYTGRILKGEKPADLPVQQVSKVELIINLKAAKALNITVPLSLLGRADEVIE